MVGDIGTSVGVGAVGWNGRAWRPQTTPDPDPAAEPLRRYNILDGISCTSRKACVSVGGYAVNTYTPDGIHTVISYMPLAERWNGAGWSLLPFPSLPMGAQSGTLDSVSCTPDRACVTVGSFATMDETDGLLAERWDGARWSVASVPSPAGPTLGPTTATISDVSCSASGFCIAVGSWSQETLSGVEQTFAELWDGSSWSLQQTPQGVGGFAFSGVSCPSPSACIAVGWYSIAPGLPEQALAARWNGTSWSVLTTPTGPGVYNSLESVSCASPRACVAVGATQSDFGERPLVERWDGTRWSIEHPPNVSDAFLQAVSCTSSMSCTAVGSGARSTVVEQTVPASAKLSGVPIRCASGRVTLHLSGADISSVVWSLDGQTLRGHSVHRGALYTASFQLWPGRHRLTVKVEFERSSQAHKLTLRPILVGCPAGR